MEQEQDLEKARKDVYEQAKSLCMILHTISRGKKWIKPINIKKELRGETEDSIKSKLDALVSFGLAVKDNQSKDSRYMLLVTDNDRIEYLQHYIDYLKKLLNESEHLLNDIISKNKL